MLLALSDIPLPWSVAVEIKFKDKSKYALMINLVKDEEIIEKNKKIQPNDACVVKWDLSAWFVPRHPFD